MRTVEDCLKDAWQALLKGDTDERDRQCKIAKHILNQQIRVKEGGPLEPGEPIILGQATSRAADTDDDCSGKS